MNSLKKHEPTNDMKIILLEVHAFERGVHDVHVFGKGDSQKGGFINLNPPGYGPDMK